MNSADRPLSRVASRLTWLVALGFVVYLAAFIAQRETGEIANSLRMLKNGEPHERGAAIWELGQVGPQEMDRVVPALIQALNDEDGFVRSNAATALGRMKLPAPWNQTRIDQFLVGLRDPDFRVRAEVAPCLPLLGANADLAIPALIEAAGIGESASDEEAKASPHADDSSLATLADWKPSSEQAAFEALGVYAKRGNRQALSIMMSHVRGGTARRQAFAINSLGPFAGSDQKAFDLLVGLAREQDPNRRAAAVDALGVAAGADGDLSHSALEELLRLSDNPDLETRKHAIQAFFYAPRYFWEFIPALEKAFRSQELSNNCMTSLQRIIYSRSLPPDFSPLNAVRSEYAVIRYIAVRTLDSSRDEELAALLGAFRDEDPHVRLYAGWTIGGQSDPKHIRAALKALTSPAAQADPAIRMAFVSVFTPAASRNDQSALEALIRLAEDRDPGVRVRAIRNLVLSRIGGSSDALAAVEKPICRAFQDENPEVRLAAQSVIEEFTRHNRRFISIDPTKSIAGIEPGERFVAVLTCDPKTPAGIAVLIEGSRDPDARIRRRAMTGLQKVGAGSPQTEAVLQILSSASQDQDTDVRQAAMQAKSALEVAIKHWSGK